MGLWDLIKEDWNAEKRSRGEQAGARQERPTETSAYTLRSQWTRASNRLKVIIVVVAALLVVAIAAGSSGDHGSSSSATRSGAQATNRPLNHSSHSGTSSTTPSSGDSSRGSSSHQLAHFDESAIVHRFGFNNGRSVMKVTFVAHGSARDVERVAHACVRHFEDSYQDVLCYGFPSARSVAAARTTDAGYAHLCWTGRWENTSLGDYGEVNKMQIKTASGITDPDPACPPESRR